MNIPPKIRIQSIDLLRGIIMVIMALDHVRDYFHWGAFHYDPMDLQKTSVALFFTRWITHYCAPTFMFLAGLSAFLSGQKKTKGELSLFLLKRGLWLVFVELVIMNFGWNFNPFFPYLLFIVIWALGFSMILLAGLIYIPRNILIGIGLIIVFGHNLLDGIPVSGNNFSGFLWSIIHVEYLFKLGTEGVFVGYPIIPWVGVMALGYCLGDLYTSSYDPIKRKQTLMYLGAGSILLFILIRGFNHYGDSLHWSIQKTPIFTLLSFLKVSKYPPSLLYILMTLGPGLLFLAFSENVRGKWVEFFSIFGRVPMFYYILHIYLIHLMAMLASSIFTNLSWKLWIFDSSIWFMGKKLVGYGFSLVAVYGVWIMLILILYPLCKAYDRYKQSHRNLWWLTYL